MRSGGLVSTSTIESLYERLMAFDTLPGTELVVSDCLMMQETATTCGMIMLPPPQDRCDKLVVICHRSSAENHAPCTQMEQELLPLDCLIQCRFDAEFKTWCFASPSSGKGPKASPPKRVRFALRKNLSRAHLKAAQVLTTGGVTPQHEDSLFLVMPTAAASPTAPYAPSETSSSSAQNTAHDLRSDPRRRLVNLLLHGEAAEEAEILVEVRVRGRPVHIGLQAAPQAPLKAATASSSSPTVRIGHAMLGALPSPPGQHHLGGGGGGAPKAVKAISTPLAVTLDLGACQGPGLISINVWSPGSLLLLASCKGLLLPPSCDNAAREMTRCEFEER